MNWDQESIRALRLKLAFLIPAERDVRSLIEDAGLDPAYIDLSGAPVARWYEVLSEAKKQLKLDSILARAIERYPYDEMLIGMSRGKYASTENDVTDRRGAAPQDLEKIIDAESTLAPASSPFRNITQSNLKAVQNNFDVSNTSVNNLAGDLICDNKAPENLEKTSKKVILFLGAQPTETVRLRLDEEIREIEEGLKRSKFRDRFELRQQWAVRSIDLRRALLEYKPYIVHFAGHGVGRSTTNQASEATRKLLPVNHLDASEEGLVLEDQAGQPKLVSTEALANLFELFRDSVECVVLNACYSEQQAKAIVQHIPFVIGMNQAIGDRAAIEFSIGFYDALRAGESVEFAYKSGCTAIHLAGIPEHLTPKFFQKAN